MNAQQQLLETQVAAEDLARLLEQAVGLAQKAVSPVGLNTATKGQVKCSHPEEAWRS
jgi:hypothetical protein